MRRKEKISEAPPGVRRETVDSTCFLHMEGIFGQIGWALSGVLGETVDLVGISFLPRGKIL